ncbi:MAG: oxidoreductase [Planctomycetota bacterium]
MAAKPTIAVFKFASCDGCQLSLLSLEDELLLIADCFDVAYFPEARSRQVAGPYDVGLVEGSISTAEDIDRIQEVRRQCRTLVTIGACATAGGIQALRNWADHAEFQRYVYAEPAFVDSLATSTPVAAHVKVDYELRGCPIDKGQLLTFLSAMLRGATPRPATYSVCVECKRRSLVCLAVSRGVPCLGPVTQAGCGALCPSFGRGCFGCFGPHPTANVVPLLDQYQAGEASGEELLPLVRGYTGYASAFREAGDAIDPERADHE